MVKTVKADACVDMFGGILDQADHTYVLTGDLVGTACFIYANNITIDGSGIYKIQAVVASRRIDGAGGANGSDGLDFTIRNVIDNPLWNEQIESLGGNSYSGIAGSGGNVTIENSTLSKKIYSRGGLSSYGTPGNGATVTIRNSTIDSVAVLGGGTYGYANGGNGGNIIVENSNIQGVLAASGGYSYNNGDGGNGGNITIENSVVLSSAYSNGGYGSYFYGNGGNITIINSEVDTVSTTGFIVGSLTITDDAPTVTITGDENMTIAFEDVYAESGATAEDVKYTTTDLTGD
ncbi:MAG: hypothetical protein WAV10_01855, partial [Minisyncoccia bacterium]